MSHRGVGAAFVGAGELFLLDCLMLSASESARQPAGL